MIKSSDLINLLKDRSVDFTKEELEKLIENELQTDESEMDTELIECCIDVLNEKKAPVQAKKKKPAYIKFILFAAAAAVLIFVNVAAFGKLGETPAPVKPATDVTPSTSGATESVTSSDVTKDTSYDELTEETSDKEETSLKGEISTTKKAETSLKGHKDDTTLPPAVSEQLKAEGFDDTVLPKDVVLLKIKTPVNFNGNSAEFSAPAKGKKLNITITKGQGNSASTTHKSESVAEETLVTVNSVSVNVRTENNTSTITYSVKNNAYRITLESSHQEAIELAKTIL